MTATSRAARVLATLLACLRLTVIAVLGLVVVSVVQGEPVHASAMPTLRRNLSALPLFSDAAAVPDRHPADQLRGDLQALLAHHSTLSVRFMRATVAGDPAIVDTADAVLVGNTTDLESVLRPAIGGQHAAAFANRWQLRTGMLFRYAAGVRDGNPAVQQEARHQLASFDQVIAALLAEATDGRVAQHVLADRLGEQTDRLLAQAERFAEGDHERAYRLQRKAYAKMYPLGGMIAAAATDTSASDVTPTEQLRTALARLLGEHVELSVDTMRAGLTGADEFDAAAAALDANTADIAQAMHSLLDADDAAAFTDLWADHIDLMVRYTIAVTETDEQARADVRAELTDVVDRFGAVLAAATDDTLDEGAVEDAMRTHHQHMLDQIERYAADDLEGAHTTAYDAFTQIDRIADTLAAALADVVSAGLPQGGAATGGGGDAWIVP